MDLASSSWLLSERFKEIAAVLDKALSVAKTRPTLARS